MMVKNKIINLYRITHRRLKDEGWLVIAYSVKSAIDAFREYYASDYDIDENDITGVTLEKELDVLVDDGLFKE